MDQREELMYMLTKFEDSGWDLIALPSKNWMNLKEPTEQETINLLTAIEIADNECGSCGCEFDTLYKKTIMILKELLQ
ncbi:MAG: hypothetical protein BGO41_15935 [Clostridiales bacterium 38-18]|nr:MAG: hypothetical protein BGO41_15935 [Clostridiales bacterium 38-18]